MIPTAIAAVVQIFATRNGRVTEDQPSMIMASAGSW
jgi:hypothetical protein